MIFLFSLSPTLVENLFKYTGTVGILWLFLFVIFRLTVTKPFFSLLSQRRKLIVLLFTPILIWSAGVVFMVFDFYKIYFSNSFKNHKFFYQGQILDEKGSPLSNAYAFIILGKDTINCLASTGTDGQFTIELDTMEGIKTTVYYGHNKYRENSTFRALNSSSIEQFELNYLKNKASLQTQATFYTNINNQMLISALEQKSNLKFSPNNSTFTIAFLYDTTDIDHFDNRYRYLGGKVKVLIDNKFCCESHQSIAPTNAIGSSMNNLKKELQIKLRNIVLKEQDHLTTRISQCISK